MNCTEEFENELLEIFLDSFSSKITRGLSKDGDALFTSYDAVQILQEVFETLVKEINYVVKKINSKKGGEYTHGR